jgi:membrane-associated phospholipid phosphatase
MNANSTHSETTPRAAAFAVGVTLTLITNSVWAQDASPAKAPVVQETVDSPETSPQQQVSQQPASQQQDLVEKTRPNPLQDPRDRIYYPGDTEHFKPLTEKLWGNFLLDQKEIWTSPFHMRSEDAKWWLGFGGVTAALIATDKDAALHPNPNTVTWSNGVSNIGTSYTLAPLLAGFYAFGVLRDNPKAREAGILGTEALVDSLVVTGVLKVVAGRNRPDNPHEPGNFFEAGTGFPSGHAMQSWAVASILSYEYGHTKVVPIIAIGLAAVVSTARFTAQRHYASDIVAGGGMGWFIGRYVWKTHQDHAIHPHGKIQAMLVPQISPGTGSYGAALELSRAP